MLSNTQRNTDDTIIPLEDDTKPLNNTAESAIPPSHCAYLPYVKKVATWGLSIGTTISTAIYSLGFPSHTQPANISWKWWYNLSKTTKLLSIGSAAINFTIGVMVRNAYFPKIAEYLSKEFALSTQSASHAAKNTLVMLLAIIAAIAGGALVYEGMIATGALSAGLNALGVMLITAGFRFVSLNALFEKIINLFDQDYQFQQNCIKHLKTLSQEHADEMNQLLQGKEVNEETVREFLTTFYNHAFPETKTFSKNEIVTNTAGKTFDLTLGLALGAPYFLFCSQKGLDGIRIIAQYAAPAYSLQSLSLSTKMIISMIIGSSSGALAFLAGYDFRVLLLDLYEDCKKHYIDILKILVILPATTISALSLTSAAQAVTASPNLFEITDDAAGTLFTALLTLMAVCFDFKAIADYYILQHPEDQPAIKDVIHWMEKNKLPKETITGLKNNTFFAQQIQQPSTHTDQEHRGLVMTV